MLFPEGLVTDLVWEDNVTYGANVGGGATPSAFLGSTAYFTGEAYAINDLYDPYYNLGGAQPRFTDQFAQFFNNYKVTGARITVSFVPRQNDTNLSEPTPANTDADNFEDLLLLGIGQCAYATVDGAAYPEPPISTSGASPSYDVNCREIGKSAYFKYAYNGKQTTPVWNGVNPTNYPVKGTKTLTCAVDFAHWANINHITFNDDQNSLTYAQDIFRGSISSGTVSPPPLVIYAAVAVTGGAHRRRSYNSAYDIKVVITQRVKWFNPVRVADS